MVDDQMEEGVGSHLVVEVKGAPVEEEEACLEAPQEEEVRWVV